MHRKDESPKRDENKDFEKYNQIHFINNSLNELDTITIDDKYESTRSDASNEKSGNIEYIKTLQLSLKDAINQNDILREKLNKALDENKKLQNEIEEKNNAIYELGQYYQYCIEKHYNSNSNSNQCINLEKEKANKRRRKQKIQKNINIDYNIRNNKKKNCEIYEIVYIK